MNRADMRTPVDHQRSRFLRSCRERIRPEDVGLSPRTRARSPGLRREDVATLSGVSASWYTWLEQGRDIRVSDDVLDRISTTLRLTEDERTYLFALVQHRVPRLPTETGQEAPPDVARMVHAVQVPAVAMNLRYDVLAWNAVNSAIYRDYGQLAPDERNLLEILLIKPVRHLNAEELEYTARRLVGRWRFNYSKCADDPRFETLFRRLMTHSQLFQRLWREPDFNLRSYGVHHIKHERFGMLAFEHTSYVPDGHPNIRVVICTPEDAAAQHAVATVNAELVAQRDAV